MRITRQLLKKHSSFPLEEAEYIDLSDNDIVAIERLEACKRLHSLVLCNNKIDSIRNVYCCRHLWSINLTGNKVKSLSGLSRFPVLGMLNLSYNDLDWKELKHLSHMTLLCLTLLGNRRLDSDPHYREHVVDTLPHVWMLDGRMITAEEKKNVAQFFTQSQTSAQPVRHKAAESVFVPTSMKNLLVTGVFGDKTTHLMSRFPVNYTHNVDMDKRRLAYLAYSIQQELQLPQQYTTQPSLLPDLETLMEERHCETEQCNMLLLLMMAGLQYDLPLSVMKATLETARLNFIGNVSCVELFNLPAPMTLHCMSLLLSAAALDREEKKHEGGLYNELYKSLCVTMDSVQKKLLSQQAKSCTSTPRKVSPEREAYQTQCHCLLASEVIHLMCLVPVFFESMDSSRGLMHMIEVATKTPNVSDVIGSIAWKVHSRGGDIWDVYHDVASYLLEATSENVKGKRRSRKQHREGFVRRTTSQLLQSTQPKSPGRALRALSAGAVSRRLKTRVTPKSATYFRALREPELGDLVLVSDNQAARIVALPESGVAVLQMNSKTVLSNPPDSYFYTDTSGFVWDRQLGCWTKDNLAADLSRSRLTPSPPQSTVTLPSSASLDGSEYTLRTDTPDLMTYYNHPPHGRPLSQMSYRSDDLHTIPSQDELDDSEEEDQPTTMRVDVSTSGPVVPGSPQFEHRRHVLQQYSAHSLGPDAADTEPNSNDNKLTDSNSTPKPASSTSHIETHAGRDVLLTLPPKVHLVNTWDAGKSLPSTSQSLSSKPHSCHQTESLKQSARIEPHMPPLPTGGVTRPPLHTAGSLDAARQQPAVMYDAWAVAKSNVNVKSTVSSSSRLMSKRQPKTPPVTRKSRATSGHRPDSRGSTHSSTVVLQQRQPRASPINTHMDAYRAHALTSVGKSHYTPFAHKSFGGPATRRLGDMRSLYIGGTSIG